MPFLSAPRFLLILLLFAAHFGCANKVIRGPQPGRELVFDFTVRGRLALDNPDITYYVILNAPTDKAGVDINPTLEGPYVNGPNTLFSNTDLVGRLPFTGLQLGDVRSIWTHFFYIQGAAGGTPEVGYGQNNDTQPGELGNVDVSIVQPNYPANLWERRSESTFRLRIPLQELGLTSENSPNNIPVNLAVSQNLTDNRGFGIVYDNLLSNTPTSLLLTVPNNSPFDQLDNTQGIALNAGRILPNRPLVTTLPSGVNDAAVDIIKYEYTLLVP